MTSDALGRTEAEKPLAGYVLILLLIVISYALCAAQITPNPSSIAFLVQLATVAVIMQVTQVGAAARRVGWIVLTVAGLAALATQVMGTQGRVLDIVLSAASAVAYLVAPVAVIAHQIRRDRIDGQTLLAASAAYVLVGMFFAFLYNLLALTTSVPTFGPEQDNSLTSQLFFSFTTLTTTGYGNLVPAGAIGQSIAIAEAIAGQLFLVIAVARVVAGWERAKR